MEKGKNQPKPPDHKVQDRIRHRISKRQPQRPSETLVPLLSSHKEVVLGNLRGRWALSLKGELQMFDDLIDNLGIFDKGDNVHGSTALGTG